MGLSTSLPSPSDVAAAFCRSLAHAAHYDAPYAHFYAQELLPAPVVEALAELPLTAPEAATRSGKREDCAERIYFAGDALARFPAMQILAQALQSAPVASAISALCGIDLAGSHLRLEYAIDTEGFWLAPHTDIGVKKFTCLISLADDNSQSNLGTDIYNPDNSLYKRAPFRRNGALMFAPTEASLHGFAPRPIAGRRKSVIFNYVGAEWRASDQLAFPDEPVGISIP
ncbi:MAG: 2OG-Fe(II) oxygenase [Methylovirgula sp.]